MKTRRRYQRGCLRREKRATGPAVWTFRYRDGKTNRRVIIGTVEEYKSKAEATKACDFLRSNINRGSRTPRTLAELVAHYTEKELGDGSNKAHSTRQMYGSYIRTWILPNWGKFSLSDIRTVDVEQWLGNLPLANASRAKIRNIMHALYNHAIRYEWMDRNPISLVRQSAKRESTPDVLTVEEISGLVAELQGACKVAVFTAFSTALRVSELLALRWCNVDFGRGEIRPSCAIVNQVTGSLKTEASEKPVPMDQSLAAVLLDWRGQTPYNQDSDFVFGSPVKHGVQPYWPDSMLRKVIRPAAIRAGITKRVGWHSFRRTLATMLQENGEAVKVTQDLLRHASSRLTLELYAQGTMPAKRAAQAKITGAVLHAGSLLFPNVPTPEFGKLVSS